MGRTLCGKSRHMPIISVVGAHYFCNNNKNISSFDSPRPGSRGYDGESVTEDGSVDDDIVMIQSAYRGHKGRKDGRSR